MNKVGHCGVCKRLRFHVSWSHLYGYVCRKCALRLVRQ